jgi:hypothetical protein
MMPRKGLPVNKFGKSKDNIRNAVLARDKRQMWVSAPNADGRFPGFTNKPDLDLRISIIRITSEPDGNGLGELRTSFFLETKRNSIANR